MRLSIAVTNYSWSDRTADLASRLAGVAKQADTADIDTLWVADHLLQMDPNAAIDEPMLEAYTTLGFLAATTERVRIGTLVTWVSIRPPALLVKAVTTLDVLSGGRAWLGVGAGYRGDEAAMMGLPFGSTGERFADLEDLLRLADHMWRGDESPLAGSRHLVERPIGQPLPIRRPRVLIGGMGEQRTLPLVARYADACNLFDIPDDGATLRRKLEALAQACDAIDRDVGEIEVTLSSRLAPGETVDAFVQRCHTLADGGIDHVVLVTTGPWASPGLDIACAAAGALGKETDAT